MKKTYSKPMAYIETLSLVQQIASCGPGSRGDDNPFGKVNSGNPQQCEFRLPQFGGVTAFLTSNDDCQMPMDEGVDYGGYCYNTVSPGHTIFAS